jgi:NAD(P)-dependent dehydrogenase (short-subunit alcohol dehydrogenase family)
MGGHRFQRREDGVGRRHRARVGGLTLGARKIDTLINNAGVFLAKPFTGYAPEDFALITSVNTVGFFHTTQRVISQMLTQGNGGHIINVTSVLAEQGQTAVPAVLTALTKGGLDAQREYAQMHPQNRIGAIADVVRGALYLEDAPFVTGEILHIDGGQSAGH